jgi:hypothetical protein
MKENPTMKWPVVLATGLGCVLGTLLAGEEARKFSYVDLQPKANQQLTDNVGSGIEGNNLANLPKGEQTLEKVKFRIADGFLQLGSQRLPSSATRTACGREGCKLNRSCRSSGRVSGALTSWGRARVPERLKHEADGGNLLLVAKTEHGTPLFRCAESLSASDEDRLADTWPTYGVIHAILKEFDDESSRTFVRGIRFLEYCHWLGWYKYYLMSFRAPASNCS